MNDYLDTIYSLVSFTCVSIIFLIILSITLKLVSKKFNLEKLRLYGIFLNMTNHTIIAFSLVTFTYLLLVWMLVDQTISYVYVASIICSVVIADLYANNYPHGFINLLNAIISIVALCFVDYLNNLVKLDNNVYLTLIMVFVMIFLFLYFTYMTFRNLNYLVNLEKNRIIKNKRGNRNENR